MSGAGLFINNHYFLCFQSPSLPICDLSTDSGYQGISHIQRRFFNHLKGGFIKKYLIWYCDVQCCTVMNNKKTILYNTVQWLIVVYCNAHCCPSIYIDIPWCAVLYSYEQHYTMMCNAVQEWTVSNCDKQCCAVMRSVIQRFAVAFFLPPPATQFSQLALYYLHWFQP